ncbi:ferritin family protein [Ruminiclostridium cellulolyticum]|uniref:Rubrerythrin family protein n=1 Tax=Ruminiclostridium cellulolyticum (strain ATCC 35319 / DSM 5812 / JCM 6584 / H10) TaxID=394503 RepID=B8I2Z0_RUMCH|nr:ferritin-like domain-containing protein [Ruminiclostridium cellulolyticum]ACL76133.1 rubrerythrin family protein [Ruminiclostridium cellulolyticum H10]
MSYTYPSSHPQGTARKVTNRLREIMIAELIAINGYQSHLANSNMINVNEVWHHIMLDEIRHYETVLNLLRKYDPVQYKASLEQHEDSLKPKSPMQLYNPSYDKQIILNNIREAIKGELEAVILYEEEIEAYSSYKDIKIAIQAIINDEKEHAEHLTQVMKKYESEQFIYIKEKGKSEYQRRGKP